MSDPFARPSSRNSNRRHTAFDPNFTLPPPIQTFPQGYGRLPSLGSMSLSSPVDFDANVTLPPLRNLPPRTTTPRMGAAPSLSRRPSFSRSSTDFPMFDNNSSSSLPPINRGSGSRDPFAIPELPPLPGFGDNGSGINRSRTPRVTTYEEMVAALSEPYCGPRLVFDPSNPQTIDLNPGGLPPSWMRSSRDVPTSPTSPTSQDSRSHQSKGIRKWTKRTTFSSMQLDCLEELWEKTEYPGVDEIDHCAAITGLTAKQVRTWFGNTRQARLAGTRKEARNAGIPGVPGSAGPRINRSRGDTLFSSSGSPTGSMPRTPQSLFSSIPPSFGSGGGGSGGMGMGMPMEQDFFKVPRSPADRAGGAPLPSIGGSRSRRQSFSGGYSTPSGPELSFGYGSGSSSSSSGSYDFSSPLDNKYPMRR